MLIDLAFVGIFFLLAIPTVTGYFAYSYGLSFWRWFALGCFLPIIANILLLFLVKSQKQDVQLTRYEDEYMDQLIEETFSEGNSFTKNQNKL